MRIIQNISELRLTKAFVFVSFLLLFCVLSSCFHKASMMERQHIDSLNLVSEEWRYRNLDSSMYYALEAEKSAQSSGYGMNKALLNQAFVLFFRMDFKQMDTLIHCIYEHSNNQVELLNADVLMMRMFQRTSRNQKFYVYRNQAQKRIKRIKEEYEDLNKEERALVTNAIAHYHLAAARYYYDMEQEALADQELKLISEDDIENDIPLYLEYMYQVGYTGYNLGMESDEILLRKFDILFKAFATSRYYGYTLLEAHACLFLAKIYINPHSREFLREKRPGWYDYLYTQFMGWYDAKEGNNARLPFELAQKALQSFKRYGYLNLTVHAYQALGFFYIVEGDYAKAEENLHTALNLINDYHKDLFQKMQRPKLEMYLPDQVESDNPSWLFKDDMYTMPDWLAKEREQLSVLYTVLGNREAAAYNRGMYLKILEVIRKDSEIEHKYKDLEEQTRTLNAFLMFVLLFIPVVFVAFFVFFRVWTSRSKKQTEALHWALDYCDSLVEPQNIRLDFVDRPAWSKYERRIVQTVFHAFSLWAQNTVEKLRNLDERYQMIRDEQFVSQRRIIQYKRKNIGKRAKINLVYTVLPLIDRLLHEFQKYRKNETYNPKRLDYAIELTDRINLYNEILAKWIILNRGELSLHIETFPLQELLEVLKKNHYSFQRKGVELSVADTELCVKADKALTLFMMNTLMDNARKFTDSGGKVSICVDEGPNYVEISVVDTGEGMKAEDVETILENKVYDSRCIGNHHHDSRKGQGFGLMNCKGIIEKYRKTNALFQVCMFMIESQPGKGSRFYFRLPKGVKRMLMLLLVFGHCLAVAAYESAVKDERQGAKGSKDMSVSIDPDLQQATIWSDSLFFANTDQAYKKAIEFSDSAFACINRYYLRLNPEAEELLCTYNPEIMALPLEVKWCQERVPMDYALLLSLRNETAIAAMNLQDWGRYFYNNKVYTQLYKALGQDASLEEYCAMMEESQKGIKTSIVLLLFATFVAMLGFYILYFRKRIAFQLNMRQITEINNILFERFQDDDREHMPEKLKEILELLWHGLNEIHQVWGVRLLLLREDHTVLLQTSCGDVPDSFLVNELMERVSQTKEPLEMVSGFCVYPLLVRPAEGVTKIIGAVLLNIDKTSLQDSDLLLDRFIVRCFSIILYQKVILMNREYENIELACDERDCVRYEEDALYVQNQILDNCLSAIKHESMYYPSRIRQVLDKLLLCKEDAERKNMSANLEELIVFYRSIYSTLFQQAKRQLKAVNFRRRDFMTQSLLDQALQLFNKMSAKRKVEAQLRVQMESFEVRGDEEMLLFLLENLFSVALDSQNNCGTVTFDLTLRSEGDFVRFTFHDPREHCYTEDVADLFMPEGGGIPYLICKQIIREHDTYMNFCGCRINAEKVSNGMDIWFTIPKKK